MMLQFLGTSSMVPTKDRNHQAMLLKYRDENIIIDCGEGTQRQLRIAGLSAAKLTKLLITHWHGDHVLGIPGLIQTMAANEFSGVLHIYGPKGTEEFIDKMLKSFMVQEKIKIQVHDIIRKRFIDTKHYAIEAFPLKHSAPCMGFKFIEKDSRKMDMDYLAKIGLKQHPILKNLQDGKDITWKGKIVKVDDATKIKKGKVLAIISDTKYFDDLYKSVLDSDLLVCEATYSDEVADKAENHMHMTPGQAARVAKDANVKKLILTHFSQRYKDVTPLKKEAKKVFKDTECAKDFMKVSV